MLWTNLFSRLHPAPRRPYGRATAIGFRPRLETLETRELLSTAGLGQLFAQPNIFTLPTNVVGLTPAQVRHAYGFDKTEIRYRSRQARLRSFPTGRAKRSPSWMRMTIPKSTATCWRSISFLVCRTPHNSPKQRRRVLPPRTRVGPWKCHWMSNGRTPSRRLPISSWWKPRAAASVI